MRNHFLAKAIVFIIFFLNPSLFWAQEVPQPTLESPYNTMYVHLYYLQGDSYQPEVAARTIYGKNKEEASKLAIQLKQIFDGNALYVRLNLLPHESTYIDSTSKKPYYTPFPEEMPAIYLERIEGKWYYSRATIAEIPALHKKIYPLGSDFLLNLIPQARQGKILGLALWQYVGIAIVLGLIFILHLIINGILRLLLGWFNRSRLSNRIGSTEIVRKLAKLGSLLIVLRIIKMLLPPLQLPIGASQFLAVGMHIFSITLLVLIGLRIVDLLVLHTAKFTEKTTSKLDDQLIPILKRIFQTIVVIMGVLQVLHALNVNVTALIAGISIGGLALALAAQDTVKHLIGSAMIFFDQPFQIGDYIDGGGISGTVLEVGFRTTRLSTPDSSVIAVPNGNIANMSIKNMGVRVYRLYTTNLGLTYDTPPDLIEQFIIGLKELIKEHPKTSSDNYYVHLNAFGDSALTIFFRAYLQTTSYAEELAIREELILGIMRLAEALSVRFAFPSSTLYIEDFPEKSTLVPTYNLDKDALHKKMNDALTDFKNRNNEQ